MSIKSTPLGDMHNGRQTCLIQSETDTYITKPRSSKTEEAFDLFCQKLTDIGLDMFARAPRILQKSEYEHSEQLEKNNQTDQNGVRLYYKHAGALLFFAYLLGSTDLHCENLIADGNMPVLLDLETLLTGKPRGASDRYNLSQSVMRSHLLCNFMCSETGIADVSGFSGVTAQLKNIPHTAQGRSFLWNEREAFVNGFKSSYRFTLAHKNEIAELIRLFDRCEFRQILRPTNIYASVSMMISKLADNKKHYANALLSKAYERDVDKNRLEKAKLVLSQEVDAVLKCEIPRFYTYGNETSLYCNGQKVLDDHLMLSPVDYALLRLNFLSDEDLANQIKIIDLAIDASTPLDQPQASATIHTGSLCAGETAAELVTKCALDNINSVFCGLQRDNNDNVNFVSVGFSMYQGLCGILCMYASLFRKTGKRIYTDNLYRYYENVRSVFLNDNSAITLTSKNSSLADGILGVISCLEHIGRLTEDDIFINDAKAIAQRLVLTEALFNIDYLNGIGSLPLVFSRLGMRVPSSLISLLESTEPFTTGVAHGSSGIALSLCTQNTTDAARDIDKRLLYLLQWENEQYSIYDNNWFDLRDKNKKGFMSGWCSGAPGIGMARQYIQKNTDCEQLKSLCKTDIERVKVFLSTKTTCKKDTLCCGTSSVLMAASVLGVAVDEMYAKLCEAEKHNELRVSHIANTNDTNVSLMQGLSGVAYALAMYGDPLCGGMLI